MYKVFCQTESYSIVRMQAIIDSAKQLVFHGHAIDSAIQLNDVTVQSIKDFIDALDVISCTQFKLRRQLQKVLDDNKVD